MRTDLIVTTFAVVLTGLAVGLLVYLGSIKHEPGIKIRAVIIQSVNTNSSTAVFE